MTRSTESSILLKLAALFRAEGDSVTADALVVDVDTTADRTLAPEEQDRVTALQNKGIRLDGRGSHAEGEAYLMEALRIAEQALGQSHVDLIGHIYDVARCRFNGGAYEKAIESYRRLQCLAETSHGSDHPILPVADHYIDRCLLNLRIRAGAQRLQIHMSQMMCQATGAKGANQPEPLAYEDRLRTLAQRLFARGRVSWGAELLARMLALKVADGKPQDEASLNELREYAVALWDGGQIQQAANIFQAIVAIRNRDALTGDGGTSLRQALSNWGSCLAALGEKDSAKETRTLAESIGSIRLPD